MKKYAFLLMGARFKPWIHRAEFEVGKDSVSYVFTVCSQEEAIKKVVELKNEGFGAVELCGAFGRELAEEMIAITDGEMAIGYVVHNPEQDALFEAFFGA
jgi:hypothetical protein